MEPKKLVILGSTGSIGQQALDVVDKYPELFKVVGLAAKDEADLLLEQAGRYRPIAIAVSDSHAYKAVKEAVGNKMRIMSGNEGMNEIAALEDADVVLVAVSGAVGIIPTLTAIRAGKRIALANKETLVSAGEIVMNQVREKGVMLVPVDSEHSAVFQCLAGEQKHLQRIWLTASGGPFKDYTNEQLESVTVDMALKHPNWQMGPKITVDSATLMNKGLEIIEAHFLFAVPYENIKVVIHKESIIHSLVELRDGAFLAHMGTPDMRIPIQYALTYPERMESPAKSLDLTVLPPLHFDKPDTSRFPALDLAVRAGISGGTMPAVLNAANEVAVNQFLLGNIGFRSITHYTEKVMEKHQNVKSPDLDTILAADQWARQVCRDLILKGDK
ncbi:MAG: 1-deoxy-D-xylulose-5-phosphate reductoisomerase [Syntrophomonadaceae bacterium]|jgi:1-deoxy-D-xylulose-5-phosphate reductoisomerase